MKKKTFPFKDAHAHANAICSKNKPRKIVTHISVAFASWWEIFCHSLVAWLAIGCNVSKGAIELINRQTKRDVRKKITKSRHVVRHNRRKVFVDCYTSYNAFDFGCFRWRKRNLVFSLAMWGNVYMWVKAKKYQSVLPPLALSIFLIWCEIDTSACL